MCLSMVVLGVLVFSRRLEMELKRLDRSVPVLPSLEREVPERRYNWALELMRDEFPLLELKIMEARAIFTEKEIPAVESFVKALLQIRIDMMKEQIRLLIESANKRGLKLEIRSNGKLYRDGKEWVQKK